MVVYGYILAFLFLLIEILVIFRNVRFKIYSTFFWFCDFAPLLLAIGFFIGNVQYIKGIINLGFLTQLLTSVLLLFGFISGRDVIGTDSAKKHGRIFVFTELTIHLIPVNLALILTANLPTTTTSMIYASILLVFMFFLTLLFTPKKENVNLLYYLFSSSENMPSIKLPLQKYLWILYTFIFCVIPTYFLQVFLYWWLK